MTTPQRAFSRPRIVCGGSLAAFSMLVAGCADTTSSSGADGSAPVSSPSSSTTSSTHTAPSTTSTSEATEADPGWQVVGLGDSFTKTQNTQGKTYLDLFAADLQNSVGFPVTVTDLSDDANTSARLADALRHDQTLRESVAAADIVLVSVGGNDSDPFGVYPPGTCSPTQPLPSCLRAYAPTFTGNYRTILTAIDGLRTSKPTAVRVTSADNPFVGWSEAPNPSFGVNFYRQVAEAETAAACGIAAEHHALCVDYLHLFGGADGTRDPGKYLGSDHAHPGDAGIRLIADTLVALGVPELR